MADMNDVKNRLKNMLAVNEEKAAVAAEKSDHVVCVFRLDVYKRQFQHHELCGCVSAGGYGN